MNNIKTVHGKALHNRLAESIKSKDPRVSAIHEIFRLCRINGGTLFLDGKLVRLQYRGETRLASTIEEIEQLKYIFA